MINCLLVTRWGRCTRERRWAWGGAGTREDVALPPGGGLEREAGGLADPVPFLYPVHGVLLREDYVTCLAEDSAGHLLIGHRQQGLEIVNVPDWKRVFPGPKRQDSD